MAICSQFHYNLVVAVDDEKTVHFSEHLADNALLHPQMFQPSSINGCTELCTDLLNLTKFCICKDVFSIVCVGN